MKEWYFKELKQKLKEAFSYAWKNRVFKNHKITLRYGNKTIATLSVWNLQDLFYLWERKATEEWTTQGGIEMKEWKCIEGCSDCCGCTPMDRDFLKKHEHMGQIKPTELVNLGKWISPETEDGKCVFLNRETNKCAIYPDRPKVCRDYGQAEELQCPYIDLKGNRRSPAKVKRMQRQMKRQMKMQLRYLRNIVELKKSF